MAVRSKGRGSAASSSSAMHELAELAFPERGSASVNARLKQLIGFGERLGMTAGDTTRLAIASLQALDQHGQLQPAIDDVLERFNAGTITTEFREPMNLYLDRSAVAALAVWLCERCRPAIEVEASPRFDGSMADTNGAPEAQPLTATPGVDAGSAVMTSAARWPERDEEGFPQMTLSVDVWWPGLHDWEPATITASITPSLAFADENFTLLIHQDGDSQPARVQSVWLVMRDELPEPIPVYELRGSTWDGDDDAHRFNFLVVSTSSWLPELHDFLATRWASKGLSPTGPEQFAWPRLGAARPPLRASSD